MRARAALVSPRLDGWLVGGGAVAVWVAVALLRLTHVAADPLGGPLLFWLFAVASAAHFGVSYHLGYGGGAAEVRAHRWRMAVLPVVGVVLVGAMLAAHGRPLSRSLMAALVVSVFMLTIWHYVKQAYGVARVGATLSGTAVSPRANWWLRYGLYPLWGLSLAKLVIRGQGGAVFGFSVGKGLLPRWTLAVPVAACALSAVVITGVMVSLARQHRGRLPASVWTPHLAAFLWIAVAPSYTSLVSILAASHAVQYLATVHRAELGLAHERHQPQPGYWWFCVLAGAGAVGLFLTNWAGPALVHLGVGGDVAFAGAGIFVLFHLHHYAIDSVIWRSKGAHVRRIVSDARRPAESPIAPPIPTPVTANLALAQRAAIRVR